MNIPLNVRFSFACESIVVAAMFIDDCKEEGNGLYVTFNRFWSYISKKKRPVVGTNCL